MRLTTFFRSRPSRYAGRAGVFLTGFLLLAAVPTQAQKGLGEGSDLEIGGPGAGKGTFAAIADMTFDTANNLYVLDTAAPAAGGIRNNFLVQRFDNDGNFLSQFSIYDARLGTANAPGRFALDSAGSVYITQPRAGRVQQYNKFGVRIRDLMLPDAAAIAVRTLAGQEQVLVASCPKKQTISQIAVFRTDGKAGTPISLSRPLRNVSALTTDKDGCLYLLADVNQIYKFDPNGTLLTILGSGIDDYYMSDGSVLLHTVAVDSRGNIYSTTPHNPGFVTRFRPDLATYTQRAGQFVWNQAWGYLWGRYPTPYAIDRNDRLWVAVNGNRERGNASWHYRPCILRTKAGYSDAPQKGVVERSTLGLGVVPVIRTPRTDNLFASLAPIPVDFALRAANRRIKEATFACTIYDLDKNPVAQMTKTIALTDGEAAVQTLLFTPPKWGWYEAQLEISAGGTRLMGIARHLGVTPVYPNLPLLAEGDAKGGLVDSPRNAMLGLSLLRTNTVQDFNALDTQITEAAARKTRLLVQFEKAADCTPEKVAKVLARFKGRVKFWEVVNEPNLSLKTDAYVTLLKQVAAQIRKSDPAAKILAPACCGIDLNWYKRFYELGGKDACDILSLHDYEGHESIDPFHWQWKWQQLRAIMAQYGDADKPIWQTERGIGGVRGGTFLGGCQAVRVTLHRDILDTLGTPSEASFHYYTNDHGYATYPTWLWSSAGPHPAALALRTRAALIAGRPFTNTLDFGPTGNKLFLGLRYAGPDGTTVSLRNFGTNDLPLTLRVNSGTALDVADSFGNVESVPVTDGQVRLSIASLPHYVRLKPGQEIVPVPVDFGVNIAPLARCTYSASNTKNFAALTNGVLESIHAGNNKAAFWTGEMATADGGTPALEIQLDAVRKVSKMLVFGMRADNSFCALLDFEVQALVGGQWVPAQSVSTPCPPSDAVSSPGSLANTWYRDQNLSVLTFAPVSTDRLRLIPRRVTAGFLPDALAADACLQTWGTVLPPRLMLREIEIYE